MAMKTALVLACLLKAMTVAEADLSPTVQEWVDISLSRFGGAWDEEPTMIGNRRGHSTRGTMFYALGLLQRGHEQDRERACRAIRSVCKQQFIAPHRNYHGTFGRNDNEKPPEDAAIQWQDYDPNWREFIGISMVLALESCEDSLDDMTQAMMLKALHHACEGAYERNVKWRYTNISLMSALLLSWGGTEFDTPDWTSRGASLAHDIYEAFSRNKTFWEYNSPTYNGVNLWALAAWRTIGPTTKMKAMGKTMEAELWRDIARAYHAGLGNCCGPYDRSYGMDMTKYFSITGIAIALATESTASIPDLNTCTTHFHDLAYLPLLAQLGLQLPEDARAHLTSFQGKRRYARIIESGRTERRAYSFLNDTCMVGIETNVRLARSSSQYHPFTVHWKGAFGEINWIRLNGNTPVFISFDGTLITIDVASPKYNPALTFEVYAPGADESAFTEEGWNLPGLTLKTPLAPAPPEAKTFRNQFRVRYGTLGENQHANLQIDIHAFK